MVSIERIDSVTADSDKLSGQVDEDKDVEKSLKQLGWRPQGKLERLIKYPENLLAKILH